jgi:hypothetical protein
LPACLPGWLQITSSQNYTFSLNVDDDARMKVSA